MWPPRSKTKSRVHNAPLPKFGSSSFKDAHVLLSDDQRDVGPDAAASAAGEDNQCPPIFHRSRSSNNLLRTLSQPSFLLNEAGPQRDIRIPGSEKCVIVYLTTLRVVRRTFEDCSALQSMLQSFRVPVDERDISFDSRYMDELQRILGVPDKSKLDLPRVFIAGKYIGGIEEVRRLFESGELHRCLDALPPLKSDPCEACGGIRFVLCEECNGSHKCYTQKGGFRTCSSCNEYGLIRCPSCSLALL